MLFSVPVQNNALFNFVICVLNQRWQVCAYFSVDLKIYLPWMFIIKPNKFLISAYFSLTLTIKTAYLGKSATHIFLHSGSYSS